MCWARVASAVQWRRLPQADRFRVQTEWSHPRRVGPQGQGNNRRTLIPGRSVSVALRRDVGKMRETLPPAGPCATPPVNPTTSFLTATALAYAIGAGITAAAGTRLALQLILIDGFEYHPLQSPHVDWQAELLFFVAASPVLVLGNLRACCRP